MRLAERQFQRGERQTATRSCQTILETDPSHLGALELIAKCLWANQDFAALEATTRRLIALNPFEPGYFGLRGMALRALGRFGEATEALQRDPNSSSQLADLEVFQSTLVRDLLEHDAVFAAQFAKQPELAARARGLAVVTSSRLQAVTPVKSRRSPAVRQYN